MPVLAAGGVPGDKRGMTRRCLPVLAVLWSACAPPLSGFQPAHIPAQGHVQAEAGLDVSAPTGTIVRAIDAGKTVVNSARQRALTDDERRRLIEAGANLALEPPAIVMHAAVAFVPIKGWELGLRYASGAWRLGTRTQLVWPETGGMDLSVGLGLSRQATGFPVDRVLDYLTLDDLTRYSVDLPVLVGKRTPWYRLWGGPRLVLSRFSAALRLNLPAVAGSPAQAEAASVDGSTALVALQGGAAIGYAHIFLAFELTVARLFGGARLTLASAGQDIDLGGVIISPGVAVLGEF
jgi:hypothetical protein